jgi:putative hydrolase of the HAD superfamily
MEALGVAPEAGLPRRIADRYRDLREEGITIMPGVLDLLDQLRAEGMALALVTNGSTADQRANIGRFDLEHRFEAHPDRG